MKFLFRILGNLAFFAATMALLTAVSLFLAGAFLITWPVLRKSPRNRRLRATADLAAAAIEMAVAFGERETPRAVGQSDATLTQE